MCVEVECVVGQRTRARRLQGQVAGPQDGGDLDGRAGLLAQRDVVADLEPGFHVVTRQLHARHLADRYSGDRDRVAHLQCRGLQEVRGVMAIADVGDLDQQHRTDEHGHHRDGDNPEPCLAVALQRRRRVASVIDQPLAMFLHFGVYCALVPGVAASTMIGITSLRPGKKPGCSGRRRRHWRMGLRW